MRIIPAALALLISALLISGVIRADDAANTHTAKRVLLEKMGEGRFDKLDEIYGAGFVAHVGHPRDLTPEVPCPGGCPADCRLGCGSGCRLQTP